MTECSNTGRRRTGRSSAHDEHGQVTVMIVGLAVILLLATGLVVDSSAAYLKRQELNTLADGAALTGANEVAGEAGYTQGFEAARVPLDANAVRRAVDAYLREMGAAAEHPGLSYEVVVRDREVQVRLQASADLPIDLGIGEATVTGNGAATVQVERLDR